MNKCLIMSLIKSGLILEIANHSVVNDNDIIIYLADGTKAIISTEYVD